MKKVINLLLLVALLVTCMVPVAYARDTEVISVGSASGEVGQTVTVNVSLSGNAAGGFKGGSIQLSWDKASLELVSMNNGAFTGVVNPATGVANHAATTYTEGDCVLVTATFKILAKGAHTVSITRAQLADAAGKFNVGTAAGTITGTIAPCATHSGEWTVTTPATCEVAGVETRVCTVCETTETRAIEAIGHKYGDWTKVDDANHKRVCANDASHVETVAHTWNAGEITKPASCVDGEKTYTCTAEGCGATKVEPVKGTGVHTTNTWTDTGDGKTHKGTCAGCGNELTADHKWDLGTVTKQPSCNEAGVKTFKCTFNCGAEKTEEIKATGKHVYTASYVDNGDGKTHVGVCACGTKSTVAQNHSLLKNNAQSVAPNCKDDGVNVYDCTVCKAVVREVVKSTGKHVYSTFVDNKDGTHSGVCAGCGTKDKAAAHTWDAGKVTTEAKCETKGEMTFTCTAKDCGATKTEEVAAKGHKMVLMEEIKATCVAEGVKKETCQNGCGKIEETKLPIDENAHSLGAIKNDETENHTVYCKNECGMQTYFAPHTMYPTNKFEDGKQVWECEDGCGYTELRVAVVDGNLDDVPKTGDITGQIVAFAACGMAALMAVAFVFKRKAAK